MEEKKPYYFRFSGIINEVLLNKIGSIKKRDNIRCKVEDLKIRDKKGRKE